MESHFHPILFAFIVILVGCFHRKFWLFGKTIKQVELSSLASHDFRWFCIISLDHYRTKTLIKDEQIQKESKKIKNQDSSDQSNQDALKQNKEFDMPSTDKNSSSITTSEVVFRDQKAEGNIMRAREFLIYKLATDQGIFTIVQLDDGFKKTFMNEILYQSKEDKMYNMLPKSINLSSHLFYSEKYKYRIEKTYKKKEDGKKIISEYNELQRNEQILEHDILVPLQKVDELWDLAIDKVANMIVAVTKIKLNPRQTLWMAAQRMKVKLIKSS